MASNQDKEALEVFQQLDAKLSAIPAAAGAAAGPADFAKHIAARDLFCKLRLSSSVLFRDTEEQLFRRFNCSCRSLIQRARSIANDYYASGFLAVENYRKTPSLGVWQRNILGELDGTERAIIEEMESHLSHTERQLLNVAPKKFAFGANLGPAPKINPDSAKE